MGHSLCRLRSSKNGCHDVVEYLRQCRGSGQGAHVHSLLHMRLERMDERDLAPQDVPGLDVGKTETRGSEPARRPPHLLSQQTSESPSKCSTCRSTAFVALQIGAQPTREPLHSVWWPRAWEQPLVTLGSCHGGLWGLLLRTTPQGLRERSAFFVKVL